MTERELSRAAARRLAILHHAEEVTGNRRCRRGGGQPIRTDGQVDRESRQRNAWPHARPKDEERHDRDARRCQRGYVPLDQSQPQSKGGSHVIGTPTTTLMAYRKSQGLLARSLFALHPT
jgi:hypothetical protein